MPSPRRAPIALVVSDEAGAYGVGILDNGAAHEVCVKRVAMPPSAGTLAQDSVVVRSVTLTESLADGVRVDFVLPPKVR